MPSDTDLDALMQAYRDLDDEKFHDTIEALRARLAPATDTDLNILDIRALDRRWSRRYSIDTRELRARAETAERALAECRDTVKQLQDLAIWMTGCGFDFAALPYFQGSRHLLTKEPT